MPDPARTPISPPPLRDLRPDALPAYISNGLIGLRVERSPMLGGSTIVSGFAGLSPTDGVEGFTVAPYPLYGDVQVGSTWLSRATSQGKLVEIRHDFATGELTSRWRYEVEGVGVDLEDVAFCSRVLPTLVVHELSVTTDRPARLSVRSGVDPARAPGRRVMAAPIEGDAQAADVRLRWQAPGEVSECGIAYATEWVGPEASREVRLEDERGAVSTTYALSSTVDGTVRLRTIVSFVPSYSHHRAPEHQAARLAAGGKSRGFERLRVENRRVWDDLWLGRIVLGNASTRWQAITDASVYYLLASVHPATPASTSLFGLAYWPNYHYYHGHPMWDLDTFVLPPLTLLQPDAARALLDFRGRTLSAARQNAALNGHAGALYPWEASPTLGEEATPRFGPMQKDHVTLDVATAALRYIQATGDAKFADEHGRGILMGVAEWAAGRAVRTSRGYEMRDLIGPAEAKTAVDNDVWTMCAARIVLRAAISIAEDHGIAPPADWSAVADGLVVPIDEATRVLQNHDGYRLDEEKGGTPEGAGAIWPLGWTAPTDVEAATFTFAVDQQAPRYLGTPMMSALFPVWAARLGRREQAMDLLERGFGEFIDDPFIAPDEFPRHMRDKPAANPMFANLGGYLLDLLFGFPGLALGDGEPATWAARDACLPGEWTEIAVERIWVRGSPMRLEARHGERARLEVVDR